jgi:hypothetical protein
MAATDAHHDFDSTRGEGAFRSIFNGRGIRDIGTPVQPTGLQDEATILDSFLRFMEPGRNDVEAFRTRFLRPDFEGMEFPRDADDPIPYEVKSLKLSQRARESGLGYDYGENTAASFFEFIDPTGSGKAAFLIDAVCVSFYNVFAIPGEGPDSTAYFLNSREAVNDGAGKVDLAPLASQTAGGGFSVKVLELNDAIAEPVVYPCTDLTDTSDPKSLFYSIFNITMSPIGSKGGKKSIMMNYSTAGFEDTSIVVQGQRDETANSVSALTKRILGIFTGSRTPEKDRAYFKILQQKRGGDWLQVLSCLDPARYPDLPADTPIVLCTHDRICAAYALAMGVNVLYTHIWRRGDVTEHWVVYCRKQIGAAAITDADRMQQRLQRLPRPDAALTWATPFNYLQVRDACIYTFEALTGQYMTAIQTTYDAIAVEIQKDRLDTNKISATVKAHLAAWSVLATWRQSVPRIRRGGEEDLDTAEKISLYETQLVILKQVFLEHTRKHAVTSLEAAFTAIATKIRTAVAKSGGVAGAYVSNLNILGGLFSGYSERDIKKNGTGVFTLLAGSLFPAERTQLMDVLRLPYTALNARGLDAAKKYGVFLDTAALLLQDHGHGPGADVPNWLLLTTLSAAPSAEQSQQGGSYEDDELVTLSDSYAASAILAERFQQTHKPLHNPITSVYLLAAALATELETIERTSAADPGFEHYATFTYQYLAQMIVTALTQIDSIISMYPAEAVDKAVYPTDRAYIQALFNGLEKFLLNDILMVDSRIRGPDLNDFILGFWNSELTADIARIYINNSDIQISINALDKPFIPISVGASATLLRGKMSKVLDALRYVETVESGFTPGIKTPTKRGVTKKQHSGQDFTSATMKARHGVKAATKLHTQIRHLKRAEMGHSAIRSSVHLSRAHHRR